jgi:hypothetical protein
MLEFNDIYKFLGYYIKELINNGEEVKSTNIYNKNKLKEKLIEIPHQFFKIKEPY